MYIVEVQYIKSKISKQISQNECVEKYFDMEPYKIATNSGNELMIEYVVNKMIICRFSLFTW